MDYYPGYGFGVITYPEYIVGKFVSIIQPIIMEQMKDVIEAQKNHSCSRQKICSLIHTNIFQDSSKRIFILDQILKIKITQYNATMFHSSHHIRAFTFFVFSEQFFH